MDIRIALAGNPNSGKTTLFNALTGSNQFVGNWPGVTVEKKEGKLKKHDDVVIMDLPGIYSLSPYTLEEVVARNYLIEERPDAILNIIDGTNLERNLYLTTQLTELGIPVVIAVNMMDVVRKNGDQINVKELSRQLGCEIVEISALKGDGVMEAAEAAVKAAQDKTKTIPMHTFSGPVEHAIAHIEEAAVHNIGKCVGKIDNQGCQTHGSACDFCRNLYFIHGSKEYSAHCENNCTKAQGTGSANHPVAALSQHFVRNHQKSSHGCGTYEEAHADMFGGGFVNLIRHKAANGAADHFQSVLVEDPIHTYCSSRKHINLVQERNKICKSAINTVYRKTIQRNSPNINTLDSLHHAAKSCLCLIDFLAGFVHTFFIIGNKNQAEDSGSSGDSGQE